MANLVMVPQAAGVPDVPLAPLAEGAVSLLLADDPSAFLGLPLVQWGVFRGGAPVILADTVVDLDYQGEYAISNYPVEDGGFASFDKVQVPFTARVRFAAGGFAAAREALLASIEAIIGDFNLYDVVTPERVYVNANLIRHEYRRSTASGVSLMVVDVTLQEVRFASDNPASAFAATQAPSGAAQANGGVVQPVPPTAGQAAAAAPAS